VWSMLEGKKEFKWHPFVWLRKHGEAHDPPTRDGEIHQK
jgi:hypothetical protein